MHIYKVPREVIACSLPADKSQRAESGALLTIIKTLGVTSTAVGDPERWKQQYRIILHPLTITDSSSLLAFNTGWNITIHQQKTKFRARHPFNHLSRHAGRQDDPVLNLKPIVVITFDKMKAQCLFGLFLPEQTTYSGEQKDVNVLHLLD